MIALLQMWQWKNFDQIASDMNCFYLLRAYSLENRPVSMKKWCVDYGVDYFLAHPVLVYLDTIGYRSTVATLFWDFDSVYVISAGVTPA